MTQYDPSRPNQFKKLYNEYKKEKEIKKSEMLKSYTEELKRKKNLNTIVNSITRKTQQPSGMQQDHFKTEGKRKADEISVGHEELEKSYIERTNISADDAYARRLAMSQPQTQSGFSATQSGPSHQYAIASQVDRRNRKILLEGAVKGSTDLSEDQIKELQKEIVRQCNRYGVVTEFQYHSGDGSCLITFKTFEMAEKACMKLNGRVFDGQSITCVLLL